MTFAAPAGVVGRLACRRQVREIAQQRKAQSPTTPVAAEEMLERNYRSPDYEYPIDEVRRSPGVGNPAGVYWLNGTTLIAAHDSTAERTLLDDGAVLVATLSFELDQRERVQSAGCLERVDLVAPRVLLADCSYAT